MYLTPFSRTLFILLLCGFSVLYELWIRYQLICRGPSILGKCIICFIRYISEIFPRYFRMRIDSSNAIFNANPMIYLILMVTANDIYCIRYVIYYLTQTVGTFSISRK